MERIIQVIGMRPDCSALFWETYFDIEEGTLAIYEDTSTEAKQQRLALEALYLRAFRIPHKQLGDIWKRYEEFMGKLGVFKFGDWCR